MYPCLRCQWTSHCNKARIKLDISESELDGFDNGGLLTGERGSASKNRTTILSSNPFKQQILDNAELHQVAFNHGIAGVITNSST